MFHRHIMTVKINRNFIAFTGFTSRGKVLYIEQEGMLLALPLAAYSSSKKHRYNDTNQAPNEGLIFLRLIKCANKTANTEPILAQKTANTVKYQKILRNIWVIKTIDFTGKTEILQHYGLHSTKRIIHLLSGRPAVRIRLRVPSKKSRKPLGL